MRTKTLFAAILAAGLMILSGCRQDEDYVLPALTVSTPTLDFTTGVELSLELTATRDWLVRTKPEWVETISPDRGPGSLDPQRVTVIVKPNEGYNRVGEILFTIGLAKSAVTVSQTGAMGEVPKGTGTLEDPYTVLGVLEYIGTLGADVESPQDVFIKGTISSITEEFSTQFGNGSFKIKDSSSDQEFTIYRALYLNNKKWSASDDQIAVGDEVVVCGRVINYKGNTPETQQNKAYIYQHNDKVSTGGGGGNAGTPAGTGTLEDPYNAAGAAAAVANLTWTSNTEYEATDPVYIKGKISTIASKGTFGESGTYGNASFYISDDGTTGGVEFYCYHVLYLGGQKYTSGTDIQVGDDVIVYGKLMNYRGNTPETASGAYLYSLNGTTEGGSGGGNEQGGGEGTPAGTGTQADPYNAAGAAAAVANLTWTSNTDYQKTEPVYVKGKICKIADKGTFAESGDYGNASFYISDDGTTNGAQFYIFRTLYFGKVKYTSGTDIKVGDEVVIYGPLMNYQGKTPETVGNESCLYSLNGSTEGGGDTPGDTPGDNPTGSSTVYKKVTALTAGQAYLLVGLKADKAYAATPLGADKTYGRLNGKEVTVSNDQISGDMAAYEFTIAAAEGGYTIAMPDGRKLAVDTEHDGTFQIGDSFDPVFTVDVADGVFTIAHKATKKTLYHGGGTYTNFSCSTTVPDDGTLIYLYQKSAE